VDIGSAEELDRRVAELSSVASGTESAVTGWRLQDLDLRGHGAVLDRIDVSGALFLGCRFDDGVEAGLRTRGALVFPALPDLPFDPYRSTLYVPAELYDGLDVSYQNTRDAVIYAWTRRTGAELYRTLGQALHDQAIDDALERFVADRRLVGVMGGHRLERGSAGYAHAARLGWMLGGRGLTVTTGGGPGAMEAANLGAYFSEQPEHVLDKALSGLAAVPSYQPSVQRWAQAAFGVRDQHPGGVASLGIPTWFYGQEPPNAFATAVAKYFKNALRESILVHLCRAGIVFLRGAAGTVQEIFQDACENYYALGEAVAPMVLVGERYWTEQVPAWPLLDALGRERAMGGSVHLVDDVAAALDVLGA
jgi:predicted Rossmann-fold nucleotide-binding protein